MFWWLWVEIEKKRRETKKCRKRRRGESHWFVSSSSNHKDDKIPTAYTAQRKTERRACPFHSLSRETSAETHPTHPTRCCRWQALVDCCYQAGFSFQWHIFFSCICSNSLFLSFSHFMYTQHTLIFAYLRIICCFGDGNAWMLCCSMFIFVCPRFDFHP